MSGGAVSAKRPLLLLETANVVAGTSNALVMVAIPWLILERSGSPAAAGVAGALMGVPGIVLAPIVGALVDRLGRRTVSVGSDLLSAVSVALFPIADAAGRLDVAVIFALTLLGAAFDPAGYTARKALIPDVAAASRTRVAQLNGIHEGIFAAGWVVGPALGAAGIATVGAVATMWLAFAAFVIASVCVAVLPVPDRPVRDAGDHDEHESVWASTLLGIRVLVRDRPVWVLTIGVAVISLLYMPTETVLLPVHFEALDLPAGMGLTLAMLAGGSMIGAFGYGWVSGRIRRSRLAQLCMTIACVGFLPMALLPGLGVMAAAGFLLGLAWGPMEPLLNSLVQDRFPASQHGRVYGVQLSLWYAAPPIGELVVGLAVEHVGIRPVFLVLAAALVTTAVVIDLLPSLPGIDRARARA